MIIYIEIDYILVHKFILIYLTIYKVKLRYRINIGKYVNYVITFKLHRSKIGVIQASYSGSFNLGFNSRSPQSALSGNFSLNSGSSEGSIGGYSFGSQLGFNSRPAQGYFSNCAISLNLSCDSGPPECGLGFGSGDS